MSFLGQLYVQFDSIRMNLPYIPFYNKDSFQSKESISLMRPLENILDKNLGHVRSFTAKESHVGCSGDETLVSVVRTHILTLLKR